MKKKLLFIEFGNAHEDGFFSHLTMLSEHFDIHLLINEKLANKLPETFHFESIRTIKCDGRSSILSALESLFYILKMRHHSVFFHTAQGNIIKILCLLLPPGLFCFGVHHNAIKLASNSFTQKIINLRFKYYFVLSDYIKDSLSTLIDPKKVSIESFYPCYYERPSRLRDVTFMDESLAVAIPGTVEQTRRDFFGLIDALKKTPLNEKIKFIILGNSNRGDGPAIKKLVAENMLEKHFVFFDAYVSASDMYSYLEASDFIAPLMHPNLEYFEDYSKFKITGSYNLAFGLKKPLLLHEDLAKTPHFKEVSVSYRIESLVLILNEYANDKSPLSEISKKIEIDERFNLEKQREKYNRFLRKMEII